MELKDLTNEAKRDLLWELLNGFPVTTDGDDSESPLQLAQIMEMTTLMINFQTGLDWEQVTVCVPSNEQDKLELYYTETLAKALGFQTRTIGPLAT